MYPELIAILLMFGIIIYGFVQMGTKSFAYPGTWFAGAWLSAIASYHLYDAVVGAALHDDVLFEGLMNNLSLTAVCFLIAMIAIRPSRMSKYDVEYLYVENADRTLFLIFAGIGFLGALANWAGMGFPIKYDDNLRQEWLREIPRVTVYSWHLYFLNFAAAMYAGRALVDKFVVGNTGGKRQLGLSLALPIFTGFLWAMSTGGRQAMLIVMLFAAASGMIHVARATFIQGKMDLRRIMRMIARFALVLVAFIFFVGISGAMRAEQQGTTGDKSMGKFTQFFDYNGLPIATHQYFGVPKPRNLDETGSITFNGFFDFGIRKAMGWRNIDVDDTNPERRLGHLGFEYYTATRNTYYDLEADFGKDNMPVAIIIMVLVSHLIFVLSFRKMRSQSMLVILPLVMTLMFWGYSHQFSLLISNTLYWGVLASLAWDLLMWFSLRRTVLRGAR